MRYNHMRFPEGRTKAVTLSYDDGCKEDIKFSEIISKYGLKCTFNLNGDKYKNGTGLDTKDVEKYILSNGHEIAIHGYYHRAEGTMRPIEGIRDVLDCRIELEKKYNMIIRGMAYPNSGIRVLSPDNTYAIIKNYLNELDIVYSRSLGGDNNSFALPSDWHNWIPTAHHNNPDLMNYIDEFLKIDLEQMYAPSRTSKLFYLWGHSYEFQKDNNWEHLIEICEKLSGKENIWYATNIEIYNYVEAYNSLIYSADGKIIYNPTLLDVWFDIDNTTYCLKSGEQKYLG